ncbi:hypothetical protein HAX54_009073 [Datura stramonium]|uniref:Transcriptional corepressor SEUSS n=1 Tax=Datura stramonium TaxID=4076 RepID=A0ABS8TF54_DATST|nr:hypothetical protein [Datura stramonium]
MVTDNIKLAPSTPFLEEQKVVAQLQQVPKPRRRLQKFKQIQDSSMSAKPFHSVNKMSFGKSDPRGLLDSSGTRLEENPKSSEGLEKERSMSRLGPSVLRSPEHQIDKNKEVDSVIIKCEPCVPPEHSLRNEKQKQLQDSYAPTFTQMKLAYQQGLLGSSAVRLPENPKSLEDLDKESSMSRLGPSVLRSPDHHITKNKEVGAVIMKRESLVPPMILEHSLSNEKQKQLQDSFAPTFAQMKLAYQQGLLGSSRFRLQQNSKSLEDLDKETNMSCPGPSVLLSPQPQIANNKEAGAVIVKRESLVPPMNPEHSLSNEKQKQLQDSFAPTFAQMKLAYQQGLLGSSRFRLQQNLKSLEDLDKETNMSCPGPSVLLSPQPQITNNKEAGAVMIKRESLVPPMIPEHSLRNEKQKQLQDSFAPTFAQMKLAYQQGLLGSSGVRLQENPKLLEDLDKGTSMTRPSPSVLLSPDHQIAKNKEVGAVIIQHESLVPPMIPNNCLRNEKQKQLQDSFAPTFSLMKLAYQQGLLGSSRICFQENPRLLEDETSMYRPGLSVLQSPVHQIANDKEAVVITKRECLVPPISEQSLRKGKQKQIPESFPSTFPQMNLASQLPSVLLMNGPCPPRVSQMNLLWLLQQQMQLSRTYEKRPQIVPDVRSIYKPGTCAQRLEQYMYRQQQRPKDNNIEFWGNLVAEFFAPNAKKRLCFSSNKHRQQINCVFPQEAWCCEICNVRPTAGFETSVEVLPRLCKIKFETGMMDELLYMDIPEECYTPSGHIVLNYAKVTEESVYETARVIREGRLRVVFSSDLKICIWEFCCSFHEVLINRRAVTPQVHQLKEAIQKFQAFAESSSDIPAEEFQRNSNQFATSIRGLARVMDKSFINDLGYTKRYVRCLQISEIVSSMKDLMNYTRKYGIGPAEAMARIHHQSTASSVANNSVAGEGPQPYYDDAISQNFSVISFAPYPSRDEGPGGCNYSAHATSPTSSTASSKRQVHQADLVEPKRKKQMTDSGENSVLRALTEPVLNQRISTVLPSTTIRPLVVQPSAADIVLRANTMSIEPNKYLSSKVKAEPDLDTSQNLAAAKADALTDTQVLDQNVKKNDDKLKQIKSFSIENSGKYYYGFETDRTVDKSYYMHQLENLNGASLFPGIHIGAPLTGGLVVNNTHSNSQQSNDQLPYWKGEIDPIDDIQFD